MSRIFWDTTLFVYLLNGHPQYPERVLYLIERARLRGDSLSTSYRALGEVIAGAKKSPDPGRTHEIRSILDGAGFSYLPFGEQAVGAFGQLRSQSRLQIADSIHLACAASAGIDLFLTGNRQLVGELVPGIQFIVDFNSDII